MEVCNKHQTTEVSW